MKTLILCALLLLTAIAAQAAVTGVVPGTNDLVQFINPHSVNTNYWTISDDGVIGSGPFSFWNYDSGSAAAQDDDHLKPLLTTGRWIRNRSISADSLWTNSAGVYLPTKTQNRLLANGVTSANYLLTLGSLSDTPTTNATLVIGSNSVSVFQQGTVIIPSPTNDPAAVEIFLSAGNGDGNYLVLENAGPDGKGFTLRNGSELYNAAGSFVHLPRGDWVTTNQYDGMLLKGGGSGWFEVGRWNGNTNFSSELWTSFGTFIAPTFATNNYQITSLGFDGLNDLFITSTQDPSDSTVSNGSMEFQIRTNRVSVSASVISNSIPWSIVYESDPSNAGAANHLYQAFVAENLEVGRFQPAIDDGANAYAWKFGTYRALATDGAVIAQFEDKGTNWFSIGNRGQLIFGEGNTNVVYRTNNTDLAFTSGTDAIKFSFAVAGNPTIGTIGGNGLFLDGGTNYIALLHSGTPAWYIGGVGISGHLLAASDGGFNIGLDNNNRPGTVNIKTNIVLAGITKVQKTALTPAEGMIVFQSDNTPGLRVYQSGAWMMISTVADP